MQRRTFLLVPLLAVAACGGRLDRLNPFNWFRRRPEVVEEAGFSAPVDPRGLVARVTDVTVEETSTGIILRATGTAPTQGYFDAELVGLPVDDQGQRSFEFRVAAPEGEMPVGPEQSRQMTAAVALSFYQLQQLSALRVAGAENAVLVRP